MKKYTIYRPNEIPFQIMGDYIGFNKTSKTHEIHMINNDLIAVVPTTALIIITDLQDENC